MWIDNKWFQVGFCELSHDSPSMSDTQTHNAIDNENDKKKNRKREIEREDEKNQAWCTTDPI